MALESQQGGQRGALFDGPRWFLAGGISGGIGRTWIVVAWGLSHVDPGEPRYMSAPSLAAAKRWLREACGVPLHYSQYGARGFHAYCLDKYVEQIPTWDEETERWSNDD